MYGVGIRMVVVGVGGDEGYAPAWWNCVFVDYFE